MEKGAKGIVIAGDGNGNMNAATIERAARAAEKGRSLSAAPGSPPGKWGETWKSMMTAMRFIASDELNPAKAASC
jgi:L-asparaginase